MPRKLNLCTLGNTLLILISLCLATCSDSQPTGDPFQAQWESAREAYRNEGAALALPLFEELLKNYRAAGDRSREALSLAQIGNCHKHMGQYDTALQFLRQSKDLNIEIGDRSEEGWVINSIGLVYWEMADYDQALSRMGETLQVAQESGDQKLEATVLNNTALVHDELGNYGESRQLYSQALDVFRELKDRYRENYVLGNVGGVLLLTGDFREAADYYRQALEISIEMGSKPSEAIDRGNLGICLLGMGHLDEASQQLEQALTLSKESGQVKEQADWHHGKASLYLRTGNYPAALTEYRTALQVYSDAGLKRQQVEALAKLGELRLLLGDPAAAEASYTEGLDLARSIEHRRGELLHLIQLGDLELRRGNLGQAVDLFEQTLEVAGDTGDQLNQTIALVRKSIALRRQDRPAESLESARQALDSVGNSGAVFAEAEARLAMSAALRDLGQFGESLTTLEPISEQRSVQEDPEVRWRLLHSRGHALEGLGRRAEALDAYSGAVDVLQSVRYRLRDAGVANAYLEDRYEPYLDVVRVSIRAGLKEQAYQASLRLRLRSYQDLLDRDPSSEVTNHPELKEKISHLRRSIEERKSFQTETPQEAAIQHLVTELSQAQSEYDKQILGEEISGGLRNLPTSKGVPRLREIQELLSSDVAVIEYILSDNALHTFVVRDSALYTRSVRLDGRELRIRVELLRNLLSRDSNDWLKPAKRLHDLLIQPLESAGWLNGVRMLHVVPHRVLHYLPFAVLAKSSQRDARTLIQDYQLGYLPSSLALMPKRSPEAEASLLAMAPERAALQFHKQEIQSLSSSFPPPVRVLAGSSATESEFKEGAADYRVIHLATHSRFNRWNPLMSALDLESDASEDGDLQVREILGLRLKADLVTLSACNTGLGSGQYSDLPPGDEFLGLTQAFLISGAKAVLASHWEVDDRSTAKLMQLFYSERERLGAVSALANAQRLMMGSSYSHPRFWAGFALFGGISRRIPEKAEMGPL